MSSKFALRSNRAVTPEGIRPCAVIVEDGRINDVIAPDQLPSGLIVEDFGDLVLMPGLVDTHVHINEPGRMEWEGFETATKAAAAGGFTCLVDMPLNSSPVTTTVQAFQEKLAAAQGKLWVDCGFYAGLVPANANCLQPLLEAGVLGVKAFLIHSGLDEFPRVDEQDLRSAMPSIAQSGLPLLVHCELEQQSRVPSSQHSTPNLYQDYLLSRPRRWEHDAVELMLCLCREFQCRTHVVHLSSADAIPILKKGRSESLPITVETCPHYLFFSSEEIPDGDTRYKCAPPIRENENRDRLWRALKHRDIDFIVSDHSPCIPELKRLNEGDFQKSWGGISSLQFGLSVVWTEARKRGFGFEHLVHWLSLGPAEFVHLHSKGKIARGFDADFVVWDPDSSFTVSPAIIHHRHPLTPYEDKKLFGQVRATYLRARKVFDSGRFSPQGHGTILLHQSRSIS